MMKSIDAGLLKTLKPSIEEKIQKLLTEAFDLALLINDKKILEDTIDRLSGEYADRFAEVEAEEGEREVDLMLKESSLEYSRTSDGGVQLSPKRKVGIGKNLVTGKNLTAPASAKIHGTGFPNNRPNKTGFKGVEQRSKFKWRARYNSTDLGRYSSPEDAAQAYDKIAFQKTGSINVLNFPEEYKNIR